MNGLPPVLKGFQRCCPFYPFQMSVTNLGSNVRPRQVRSVITWQERDGSERRVGLGFGDADMFARGELANLRKWQSVKFSYGEEPGTLLTRNTGDLELEREQQHDVVLISLNPQRNVLVIGFVIVLLIGRRALGTSEVELTHYPPDLLVYLGLGTLLELTQMPGGHIPSGQENDLIYTRMLGKGDTGAPSIVHDALRQMEEKEISPDESWVKALKEASGTAFSDGVNNPTIQEKAQAQIDKVVGKDRFPSVDDRTGLLYFGCWPLG
ncbi:hypothetical protein L210DRAFT_3506145 [Boletus edulis BED1]|uniref:Uncharacterized protein n=1 Tax=Boletus edulis BED1 TaxID=1328754 RepID=A0AAD4BPI6_BOLED|nr:hypothetical protein L210DRAFT_3506145 [Boletus edulis BED1]